MKSLSLLLIVGLLSCAAPAKVKQAVSTGNEIELPFLPECRNISVATRIIEIDGMIGFRIDDINFCREDVEYSFNSYNSDGKLIESGVYFGIGRVPYMVELQIDASYVIIFRE